MLCGRREEEPALRFRSDRIFHGTGGWYFHTREGIDVGPYATRFDAEVEASMVKALLLDQCVEDLDCDAVIREFVEDSYTLQLPKTTIASSP